MPAYENMEVVARLAALNQPLKMFVKYIRVDEC
jgi:hypothetical protein